LVRPADLPRRQLGIWHAASVCVGMVIGAGIFKTTPIAAANLGSETQLMLAWAVGGVFALIGALCFAEMAAAFPDAGGDYFFLRMAYGTKLGFLFAWSRFAVIHTGSMAMLAFVFGDYLGEVVHLTSNDTTLFAVLIILALTAVNLAGLRFGIGTQVTLMLIVVAGLLSVGLAGIWMWAQGSGAAPGPAPNARGTHVGAALVYIFLAYGGWNDAATLSAEMRDANHGMRLALVIGMLVVTALYLLVNWGFVEGLGMSGLSRSNAPAADLMLRAFGKLGEYAIVTVVAVTSITVMNAVIIVGARTTYAAARDTGALPALSRWHADRGTPAAATIAISGVSLLLVGFGTYTRGGFETMVDYLSPVFWFFMTLSSLALIVLRRRYPHVPRPYRAPFYPLLPILFAMSSIYVLYSSLIYVKIGALVGVVVLATGAILLIPLRRKPI
jgi:basic amino acid/polyamine antiporter, APA family